MSHLGSVDVCEQASQTNQGAIYLSTPKLKPGENRLATGDSSSKRRPTVHGGHDDALERAARIVPRSDDPAVSLWTTIHKEALNLWMKEQHPLTFMLWLRLRGMWMSDVVQGQQTDEAKAHTSNRFSSLRRGTPSENSMESSSRTSDTRRAGLTMSESVRELEVIRQQPDSPDTI